MARKKLEELRSQRWFGAADLRSFGHRSRMLQMGYERDDFMGKPIVGIINTWSDLQQCHTHFPVLQLPTSFPVASMACWLPSKACPFVLSRLNALHFE